MNHRLPVLLIAGALVAGAAPARAQTGPARADTTTPPVVRRVAITTRSDTLPRVVPIPGVEVSTTRAGERPPVPHAVLERAELQRRNIGRDTPMELAALPGAYAYSDAGNGIGYSYLSIRGFPQRRISVLVNGVPLNDPESHEVYWIDHPDLLASTREAQLQRGVGSALYGAASLGGSVIIETSPFTTVPAYSVTYGYGSFDTRRLMVEGSSGRLAGDTRLYGRYSRIETDGYRELSDSRLWSYLFAAEKEIGPHRLRVNLYGGPEETHLAYLGVPRAYLDGRITGDPERDRRFNPIAYPGERDHFFEPHYELIHTWGLARGLSLTQTLFYFDGEGWYDEQRSGRSLADFRLAPWAVADSTLFPRDYYRQDPDGALSQDPQGRFTVERFDLVRRRFVENRHYGWVPRLRWNQGNGTLIVGGEIRAHDGRHVGSVIQGSLPPGTGPDHVYYDYHPRTLSAGLFARQDWGRGPLRLVADLAWRHQAYDMRGDRFDGIHFDQDYHFAVPRLAFEYRPGAGAWRINGSVSHSRREPAFRDLYDAEGVGSVPLFAGGEPLIRPERVNDYELGFDWRRRAHEARVNLFRMDFRDELVYAGQFNTDLGYPILGNAARSVHQGVELEAITWFGGGARPDDGVHPRTFGDGGRELRISANATVSDNHFVEYTESWGPTPADQVRYDGNQLGFFPAVMANLRAEAAAFGVTIGAEAQYASRIYVDNTESRAHSIDPRTVVNLMAARRVRSGGATVQVSVRVLNALDERYETSGYLDYDAAGNLVPHLIPAATRAWFGQVTVGF